METNIPILTLPADSGMREVTKRISAMAIEKLSGVHQSVISSGMSHKVVNGRPYYFTPQIIEKIQPALTQIGSQLLSAHCSLEPVSQEDSPLCYGQDIVEQISVLRNTVKLAYIFEERMGKNKRWYDNRLSRSVPKMMGHFKTDEVTQMNLIIREIAFFLLSIKLQ